MDHGRRKDEVPMWLNNAVHVWTTKNDLSVVNLRDITETLRLPLHDSDDAPPTPEEGSLQADSASSNGERVQDAPQEGSINALFALMQRNSEPQRVTKRTPIVSHINLTESEAKPPSFPETKPSKAMDVEFVRGVNLPGERDSNLESKGPRQQPQQSNGVQTLALFHDPVWGQAGSSYDVDAFLTKEEDKTDMFASFMESIMKRESSARETEKNHTATLTAPHAPVPAPLGGTTVAGTPPSSAMVAVATPSSTATTAITSPPPAFPTPANRNEGAPMFQTLTAPPVLSTSSPQIAYPQGIGLNQTGWPTSAPHTAGMAMQPFQFVSVPMPFVPHGTVMAIPQPYRMPYQFYQVPPQASHVTAIQTPHSAYQHAVSAESQQITSQKPAASANSSSRLGTNVGATPFVPGGKSV